MRVLNDGSVLIYSRRSYGGGALPARDPGSVVVDFDLVHGMMMSGMSLPEAAVRVGVSKTTFKIACRQLGIDCWDWSVRREAKSPRRRASVNGVDGLDASGRARWRVGADGADGADGACNGFVFPADSFRMGKGNARAVDDAVASSPALSPKRHSGSLCRALLEAAASMEGGVSAFCPCSLA